DRVFSEMLEVVAGRGGSLLKFGGDALLLLFTGDDHVVQACASAVEMRSTLRLASQLSTSVGRIDLRMSSGIHSGEIDLFLVGITHRELLVTGPAATKTTEMEATAGAGEIVVSHDVRSMLPADFIGAAKGPGWLMKKRKIHHPPNDGVGSVTGGDVVAEAVPIGLRERLRAGSGEAEHRLATVGFVEFQGTDSLISREGGATAADHFERLVGVVQEATEREGVTLLATDIDGDGGKVILASGVPTSRHDDEGRMLRALRSVLDADIGVTLKAGVNRGHVFVGDVGTQKRRTFTVMGDTVNVAARLMAAAAPGSLLASPTVLDLSSTLYETEALEPLRVKGKKEPVQAYGVGEEKGVRPPTLERELPFHGRETETQMLVQIVTTCASTGTGGIMTITGGAGIGKTRLVTEVLQRCPGLDTLLIQSEPSGTDIPYWAFRDPMRAALGIQRGPQTEMVSALTEVVVSKTPKLAWAVPLLGDIMHIEAADNETTAAYDPQFRPDRAADAFVEFLESLYTAPLVVLAEDVHWIDEASMGLLEHLGRAAEDRSWSVVLTARPEELSVEAPGGQIALGLLDEEAARTIVIEATDAAPLRPHELEAVVSKAAGNPLFLAELLQLMRETGDVDQLPSSLDAVVSTEIDALPPFTRQVLMFLSVLGRSFRRVVANELLEPEGFALDKATVGDLSLFIIVDGEERLRFRHAVVHDVAYQSLSYRRRRVLHARAGEVIERLAGDDTEAVAEFLALHYFEAGEFEKAYRYSRLAGDKARAAYANTDAARHYKRALEAVRNIVIDDETVITDLWIELAAVTELAGRMDESRRFLSRAWRSAAEDGSRRAEISLLRAGSWMETGRMSEAKRSLTQGRRAVPSSSDGDRLRLLARLDAFEASVLAANNQPAEARDLAQRAASAAERVDEREALARSLVVLDWANFMMGISAEKRSPEAIEIYRELAMHERSGAALINLGAISYMEGDWAGAIGWYQRAAEAAVSSGNVLDSALAKANLAELLISQRKLDEARRLIAEAHRVFTATESDTFMPLVQLLQARILLAADREDSAVDRLETLVRDQIPSAPTPWTAETVLALFEALLKAQRASEVLRRIDEFQTSYPDLADEVSLGLGRVRGRALAEQGQSKEGLAAFDDALAMARAQRSLFELALLLEARAELLVALGRTIDSRSATEATTLFEQLGIEMTSPDR
ncbi:MAG: adenylate/guanylate cyclase domain-containing protein, partial [Acidimicrobiia bacterium]